MKQAIRWASDAGAPVVNMDVGPKPAWTTRAMDYQLMTYTLKEASMVAERYGIKIGLEPHQQYSRSQEGLDSIYELVKSPAIGINYDTGNSYLAGTTDTHEWLIHVNDRLVHLHAKDISFSQSDAEKGKVTGTPVGCACGDGVVDWKRVIEIVKTCPNDIVFSVECGTVPDAIRSFEHHLNLWSALKCLLRQLTGGLRSTQGIFSEFLRRNPCDIMKHSTVNPLVAMMPMFYILYHHLYNSWSIYRFERNRA